MRKTVMLAEKQAILKQIDALEEHLKDIGKMIEEDASCHEVLSQTYTVRKAIKQLEELLAEQYVSVCLDQCLASTDEKTLFTAFMQLSHLRGNAKSR